MRQFDCNAGIRISDAGCGRSLPDFYITLTTGENNAEAIKNFDLFLISNFDLRVSGFARETGERNLSQPGNISSNLTFIFNQIQ